MAQWRQAIQSPLGSGAGRGGAGPARPCVAANEFPRRAEEGRARPQTVSCRWSDLVEDGGGLRLLVGVVRGGDHVVADEEELHLLRRLLVLAELRRTPRAPDANAGSQRRLTDNAAHACMQHALPCGDRAINGRARHLSAPETL